MNAADREQINADYARAGSDVRVDESLPVQPDPVFAVETSIGVGLGCLTSLLIFLMILWDVLKIGVQP